jgi:hypothetical protein
MFKYLCERAGSVDECAEAVMSVITSDADVTVPVGMGEDDGRRCCGGQMSARKWCGKEI